ncbi:MAG: hypothetical protein ACK578_25055 [Pirellula sp.]|jgi:hypothetical protein
MKASLVDWLSSLLGFKSRALWSNELGDFHFVPQIGWVGKLPGSSIELVIGADTPNYKDQGTLATVRELTEELTGVLQNCIDFLTRNAVKWDVNPVIFKSMQIASVQILWPTEYPNYFRIEFVPDMEDRVWYVEIESFTPRECGFDH